MPSQIQITSFTGGLPAQVFVSDVYGNNNTFVGSIVSAIPPTIYFTLPSLFDFAPAVKITIIDSNGCEEFTIDECLTIFPSPTPTPTTTPTLTPTSTVTETPTNTPTPTITETPTNTPTPTSSLTPTPTTTPTPTITETPTETPTNTPTPTITETSTETPTPTITETPSSTPTSTPVASPSETPTNTPTPTITETPTETPTPTITETPTNTPTPGISPSETPTNTPTPTITETPTETPTPTITETPTNTPTPTINETPTSTPIPSLTPTSTVTPSVTSTPTSTPSYDYYDAQNCCEPFDSIVVGLISGSITGGTDGVFYNGNAYLIVGPAIAPAAVLSSTTVSEICDQIVCPSPTPSITPTQTRTPTPTPIVECECFVLFTTNGEGGTVPYNDCNGVPQTVILTANIAQQICSQTTPAPQFGIVITSKGPCTLGVCTSTCDCVNAIAPFSDFPTVYIAGSPCGSEGTVTSIAIQTGTTTKLCLELGYSPGANPAYQDPALTIPVPSGYSVTLNFVSSGCFNSGDCEL